MKSETELSNTSIQYWQSIKKMPMDNWNAAREGDLTQVRLSGFDHPITDQDEEEWYRLEREYIDSFGHSEKYIEVLKLRAKISDLMKEYLHGTEKKEPGDRSIRTTISTKMIDLERLENQMQIGLSVEQAKIHVGKWLGFMPDFAKTSVFEWHTMLEEYGKANK